MPGDRENSNLSPNDDHPLLPKSSRYAGGAVDVSSRRSIEIKPRENRPELIAPTDSRCLVDYFYHAGCFWKAVIPLDGVGEVFGQTFNFSKPKTRKGKKGREIVYDKNGLPRRTIPILNHLQSRFSMKSDRPVELYPLGSREFGDPAHLIHDMIFSLEAVGPLGITFNVRDGLAGNLLSAHRFLSVQEMVFERIVVENQYVTESPPLPLSEREKRELLVASLLRSHRAGMTETYYLYRICGTNNCTSNPFQIVDSIVEYRLLNRIGSLLYRLPLNPRLYLRVRGLDSDPSVRKLVRNEFENYIKDKETQQRKRDYVRRQTSIRRAQRAANPSRR